MIKTGLTLLTLTLLLPDLSAAKAEPELPRGKVILYSADWCEPCRRFEREVIPHLLHAGWKVGPGEQTHLQIRKVRTGTVPQFVIYREGKPVARHIGYLNRTEFTKWVNSRFPRRSVPETDRKSVRNWNYQQESLLQ